MFRQSKILIIILISFLYSERAFSQDVKCSSSIKNVIATSIDERIDLVGSYIDSQSGNNMDPVIVLPLAMDDDSRCLVVHVSAYIQPADNHAMFRVEYNGKPMIGHGLEMITTVPAPDRLQGPMISEPVHNLPRFVTRGRSDLNLEALHPGYPPRDSYYDRYRTVSYTFFMPVSGETAGKIVLFAKGCCSGRIGSGGLRIQSATLVAYF